MGLSENSGSLAIDMDIIVPPMSDEIKYAAARAVQRFLQADSLPVLEALDLGSYV